MPLDHAIRVVSDVASADDAGLADLLAEQRRLQSIHVDPGRRVSHQYVAFQRTEVRERTLIH
jgi:hypothetical protein